MYRLLIILFLLHTFSTIAHKFIYTCTCIINRIGTTEKIIYDGKNGIWNVLTFCSRSSKPTERLDTKHRIALWMLVTVNNSYRFLDLNKLIIGLCKLMFDHEIRGDQFSSIFSKIHIDVISRILYYLVFCFMIRFFFWLWVRSTGFHSIKHSYISSNCIIFQITMTIPVSEGIFK